MSQILVLSPSFYFMTKKGNFLTLFSTIFSTLHKIKIKQKIKNLRHHDIVTEIFTLKKWE